MTSKAALFALLALWGVGACAPNVAFAEEMTATDSHADSDDAEDTLTNRVWVKQDSGGRPSTIKIFLSDGTLVQDSCWETHRLSPWRGESGNALSWDEDGMQISAEIVSVTATDLVLSVNLAGGPIEEHYVRAPVPYLCPDMPKG